MYKARLSLKILSAAGFWKPVGWSFFGAVWLYNIFSVFMALLVYSFDTSLYMFLVLHSLNDIDDFAESLCWFLIIFVVCVKLTYILLRRDEIINLIQMLEKDYLKPRNSFEQIIQENYDFIARRNTKYYLIVCLWTMAALTLGGLAKGKDAVLPFKTSLPYNSNCRLTFWLTYISQTLSLISSGLINVSSETFVMVMMLQTCSQLEIIYHRLESLPYLHKNSEKSVAFVKAEEARIIRECVTHHNYVYLFSDELNNIFSVVFGVQFLGSIASICTLVYSLSTKNTFNDKVLAQCLLLPNVLFQSFIYCWFANELMLKSLKIADVFSMIDWTMLSKQTKQGIILVIARAGKPIIITGGSMIPMSLNTFVSILRASYAAYNLLKSS